MAGMTRRSAGSLVLGLAVLLQGCAGVFPRKEPAVAPAVIVPGTGRFEVRKGRPGLVIGAPHGTSDTSTDLVGRELARLTGWGFVVAAGSSRLDADGRRLNVTEEGRRVYQAYQGAVSEAAQGSLLLYVEVHGNGHRESAGRIEIATLGLSLAEAWRLKTLLELIRDSRLGTGEGVQRLEVRVESIDPLRATASVANRYGVLTSRGRALYIDLPRTARTTHREAYTALLADALSQWAALLPPPGR